MSLVAQILNFLESAKAEEAKELSPTVPAAIASFVRKFLRLTPSRDSLASLCSPDAGQELSSVMSQE
jgi:hypothetical protein